MTEPWHQGRMIAFDTETTGPDPEDARIVAAAVVVVGGGLATTSEEGIINPGIPIPAEAAAIHGITDERAQAEGQPAALAIPALIGLLASVLALEPDAPIVAFNASYDLTVLDREARRYGVEPLRPAFVVDPFVIDKALEPYRKGGRKLREVAIRHGVLLTEEEAHGATADALAAARLAWRLGGLRIPDPDVLLGEVPLAIVHAWQVIWRRDQARSLADYDRRRGITRDIRSAWPLEPWVGA